MIIESAFCLSLYLGSISSEKYNKLELEDKKEVAMEFILEFQKYRPFCEDIQLEYEENGETIIVIGHCLKEKV